MANWNTLKTAIADVINTNGNQAITGQLLQNVLNNIITNVGENSTFAGIATPSTNPGAPDGPVFYLATTAGTYSNFNGIAIQEGEAVILKWDNGVWSKQVSGLSTQENVTQTTAQLKRNLTTRLIENNESITKAMSGVYNGIITGHLYRVYIRDNNWLPSNDNDYPLTFYYKKKDGSIVQLTNVSVGGTPKPFYDIQVLEKDAELLYVRFRVAPNTSVTYTISDITDTVLKNLQNEMILQQGGIGTNKGTDIDNINRVRSFNFIEPLTKLITQGDIYIWGIAYYNKTTKEFVTFQNYKTQYVLTDSNYVGRVVFAKGDGSQEIAPSEVFGNTLGESLGKELGKFNEIDKNQSTVRLVGKGNELVTENLRLVENHIYRIYFVNNDWAYNNAGSLSKMFISHRIDDSDTGLITDVSAGSSVNKDYIIKAEKSLRSNCYQIIIRADEGEEVFVRIEDITDYVNTQMQLMLLEQGGIDTKTGRNTEEKNNKRVRSTNYLPPRSVIYTQKAVVWAIALYDPNTLAFVGFYNKKTNYCITDSYYVSRVVFAKDANGTADVTPNEVFGETIGVMVEDRLSESIITEKQIELENGLLYNLYTAGQADGLPSSLLGRAYINKATKTPGYLTCEKLISVQPQENVHIVVFEYDRYGQFMGANYHELTDDISTSANLCKVLALKGEITNPVLSVGSILNGVETEQTNRKRTSFIDIDDFDFALIEKNQKLNIRAYDLEFNELPSEGAPIFPYNFMSNVGVLAKEHIIRYFNGVKYVRFLVGDIFDSEYPDVKVNLLKVNGLCNSINYSTNGSIEVLKEFGVNDKTIVISYPTTVNNPISEEEYYSKILLRLPKNYNNYGKEVPIVLFKTGAGGFEQLSTYEFNYAYYIQYLVDQGFAVFDYHANTSKNPNIDNFGTPTGVYAAMNAYKYITEHYNVKKELFLACKSLGGNLTMLLSYSSLPVKAAGLLAPAMNPSGWCFGYTEEEQLAYAQDFGFKEGYETVLNGSRDYKRQSFKDLVRDNLDVLTGYQPMQLGITNKTFGETFVNQDVYDPDVEDSFKDIIRYVPVPIKFWVAPDDTNTPIQTHRNFVKSAINGGSTAYLRELPEGTGAHHAVDNDPNALQTTNITTRLGVHYDTMTTAWVELAEWFMKYGG